MISITVDPKVFDALKQAFPKPENSADRALTKYIRVLEGMLFQSLQFQATPLQRKLNLFTISLEKLANNGGQIGPKRIRLHQWLRQNNLSLVEKVIEGSNRTGLVSQCKLSKLVTMVDTLAFEEDILSIGTTDQELEFYLQGDDFSNQALLYYLYPEFKRKLSDGEIDEKFDTVPVDIDSVKNYSIWLTTESKFLNREQKDQALRQARVISGVASVMGGSYIQRKKPSDFGRLYYEGVSIQSVNRELRRAVLGNSWEYDIRSSVVTWKMGYANSFLETHGIKKPANEFFKTTTLYLEDKPDLMATVRHYTFLEKTPDKKEFQLKLLKLAFTAISFGAKQGTKGWLNDSGEWTNPALVDILINSGDRDRFLANFSVQAFIKEQVILDAHIIELVKDQRKDLFCNPILQTASGRISKPKILAYLYQHDEKEIMDVVSAVAGTFGFEPIAKVHDAIFFKRKLNLDIRTEIEFQMQEYSNNPYWRLTPKELKRYEKKYTEEVKFKNKKEEDPELLEFNRQVAEFMLNFG